jgi:hypothetical protein
MACGNVGPATRDCDHCCGGTVSATTCGLLGGTLCQNATNMACVAYGGAATTDCEKCCKP